MTRRDVPEAPPFGTTIFPRDGERVVQLGPRSEASVLGQEACIKQAAVVAAEGYRILYTFPLEEAARRAVRPGGPSYTEHLKRIAAIRAERLGSPSRRSGLIPTSLRRTRVVIHGLPTL